MSASGYINTGGSGSPKKTKRGVTGGTGSPAKTARGFNSAASKAGLKTAKKPWSIKDKFLAGAAIIAGFYLAEGTYYKHVASDHHEDAEYWAVPLDYVVQEIGYDLGDVYHSLFGNEGENYSTNENTNNNEHKILFTFPHETTRLHGNTAQTDILADPFYREQLRYVFEAIQDGKGTRIGNAYTHAGEFFDGRESTASLTIHLVNEIQARAAMTNRERQHVDSLNPLERQRVLARFAALNCITFEHSRQDHFEPPQDGRDANYFYMDPNNPYKPLVSP